MFWMTTMNSAKGFYYLDCGGGGGGAHFQAFLYNSETVQSIFIKFCDFNHNYIGYLLKLRV